MEIVEYRRKLFETYICMYRSISSRRLAGGVASRSPLLRAEEPIKRVDITEGLNFLRARPEDGARPEDWAKVNKSAAFRRLLYRLQRVAL